MGLQARTKRSWTWGCRKVSFTVADGGVALHYGDLELFLATFYSGEYSIALAGMGMTNTGDLTSPPIYACGPEACPANSSGTHGWQVDMSIVPYNRVVSALYHVKVKVSTPLLRGGPYGCTEIPQGENPPIHICGFTDENGNSRYFDTPTASGEVSVLPSGGEFVERSGATLDREFTADPLLGSGDMTAPHAQKTWPDLDPTNNTAQGEAYLVNLLPPVAVPDDLGNEFGKCLFTKEQLPEMVDLAISRYNRWVLGEGTFTVEVGVYLLPLAPGRGITNIELSDPGRRVRKNIHGQGGRLLVIG